MKSKTLFYFFIHVPGTPILSFIGGPLKPSKRPGYVWLTNIDRTPAFEVFIKCVMPASKQRLEELLKQEQISKINGTPCQCEFCSSNHN